ncbi:hypothetical protein QYH69_34085 [Paraburkholderia sp. SARCC-3016]|uniref:hypothetical protein n=1 Tax=Paraburkholderia sp. SARCC-3016 TaxID=3058611 RepID=UPI002806BF08|nr:hypothetical protein [Paraburkholderia sp. SARCC-3016]MDQ7982256.1 hypothetical protein [Paraburkholderia sp. SARCC-3016]
MQRAARLLASGTLVPPAYKLVIEKYDRYGDLKERRENPSALSNCVVALNMALRMNADPLMVMQNLHIIEGRPSWSSPWIIAQINNCGQFSKLRFEMKKLGKRKVDHVGFEWRENDRGKNVRHEVTTSVEIEDVQCIAWCIEKATGERLESTPVSLGMAVMEGWYTKNGSKWKTMPDQMLRYRTAAFFGRIYAPELLMGLPTTDELEDTIIDVKEQPDGKYVADVDALRDGAAPRTAGPEPQRTRKDTQNATTVDATDVTPQAADPVSAAGTSPAQAAEATPPAENEPAAAGVTPRGASPVAKTTPPAQVGMEFDDVGQKNHAGGVSYTHEDSLEMAIAFAAKGDYDSALDLKARMPEDMKQRIDAAIQSHKEEVAELARQAQARSQPQTRRPSRSYNV